MCAEKDALFVTSILENRSAEIDAWKESVSNKN